MASLTGQTIANSYKDLLQVSNSNSGVDTTARAISDGEDTSTLLYVSTTETYATGKAGTDNIVFGPGAGANLASSADNNILIGKDVGASMVAGANDNVGIGNYALDAITIGDDNIAIGKGALGAETVGQSSVAMGTAAAANQVKSGGSQGHMRNTAIGTTALYYNVTGTQNTFLGADAGVGVSGNSHSNNTGLGYLALSGITTADYSVAIGSNAGTGVTAHDYNIAIGKDSLRVCSDGYNVAIGPFTLEDGTNSYSNIAIGGYALNKHTGANTVAVGESALQKNTSGTENVAVGYQAMVENTIGENNTAIGFKAYRVGVHGDGNTAVGSNALLVATPADNAGNNTAIGSKSLLDCTTGAQNTALGCFSGQNITEGDLNTMLGWNAGAALTTGDGNICIGESSNVSASGAANQIVIGIGIAAAGDNDFAFGKASNVVHNDFDADAAWSRTSDIRKKRNIQDDTLGLEFIEKLKPVTHQWKPSNEFPKEWDEYNEENQMNLDVVIHNMIAQDVKKALDEVGCDTFGGWKERKDGSQTISREMFITPLIKAVQELSAKVTELEKKCNC